MAVREKQATLVAGKEPEQAAAPVSHGLRLRALVIGSLLVVATAILVTQAEIVMTTIKIGYLQFPPVALGLFLVAFAFNRGMAMLAKRFSLSGSDLLVIYCMMLVGAMVSSHGVVEKWIPLLIAPNYFATSGTSFHNLYDPHIQARLVPYNPQISGQQFVAKAYYEGLLRGQAIPWSAWVTPLFNWGILIVLVLFAFLCLATILRRQWVDNEKLAFPLAQLPLEIAADTQQPSFFANKLTWFGIAIPVLLYGIKEIHQIVPSVPDIMTPIAINDYIKDPPWNSVPYTPLTISFAAIGFFYLLPVDVLFSIWFFFVLARAENFAMIAYNVPTPPMPIYPPPLFTGYQSVGAYLVLVGYLFWIARPHLARVWRAAIGRERVDDSNEVMSYRLAVWGLFGSIVLSALWLWGMGMSLWLAFLELVVLIFVVAVVMARSTAEAGMLMTEASFRPIDLYRIFGSIHDLGPTNLTMLALVDNLLLRDQRGLLLTGMLDCMRISDGTRIRRRAFAGIMVLAIVIALVVAVFLNIEIPYKVGANRLDWWLENASPTYTFNDYLPYFSPKQVLDPSTSWQIPVFFVIGIVVCLFLTLMRTAFHWWPLHPLGYALAGSWTTVIFWFPCLIAWLCKWLTLRYGGMNFYAKARPFFLGMVLGEFTAGVFFVVLRLLFNLPAPDFPWG